MAGSKFKERKEISVGKEKLIDFIKPMLAKQAAAPFDDEEWIFEIKWDGFRAIAEKKASVVKLYSRNGVSFINAYPLIVEALHKMKGNLILDGEVVVLNEKGYPDFQMLQDYDNNRHLPICFYVFDLLKTEGKSVTQFPLIERKRLLKKLVRSNNIIRYSDHVEKSGVIFFREAAKMDLEGIMAKRKTSLYYEGSRTADWLKIKNHKTEDVIIAGYTQPAGSRNHFGSLVLATKDGSILKYIGNTGTGYSEKNLSSIFKQLQPYKTNKPPFIEKIKMPGITWVKPVFVCEVKFSERTKEGKLRHPVFLRMREDKTIKEIDMIASIPVRKDKDPANTGTRKSTIKPDKNEDNAMLIQAGKVTVGISHSDKIYWPGENITKGMMVKYYQSVADYILPYLKNRPESLNRNPGGIIQAGFFHKDAGEHAPSWVKSFKVYSESSKKNIDYIICNDRQTMAYLNNLGCIELNPWHSVITKKDYPDYLIVDIDPSEKNTFDQVIEVALAFRKLLAKAGAPGFCKTSGASGLHIYVPMGRKYNYENVKYFAQILCMIIEEQLPAFTTMERNLKKRGNKKIYLDYLQNRVGQTIASVYSLRPKAGAPVSTPLVWKEVKAGLNPISFNMNNTLKRIQKNGDLFKGVFGPGVDINKCLKKII